MIKQPYITLSILLSFKLTMFHKARQNLTNSAACPTQKNAVFVIMSQADHQTKASDLNDGVSSFTVKIPEKTLQILNEA